MELPTLTADHKYVLQSGVAVPSVTSILVAAGLCDLTFVNQYALDRGTAIHDAILYDHEGTLDEDALDPVVKPYLAQFRKFMAISGAKIISAEQIVYDKYRNYAGKFDLLVKLNGSLWLIDMKANTKPKHVVAQLGLYHMALAAMKTTTLPRVLGCLVLKMNAFGLHEYNIADAHSKAQDALVKARKNNTTTDEGASLDC